MGLLIVAMNYSKCNADRVCSAAAVKVSRYASRCGRVTTLTATLDQSCTVAAIASVL